MGISAIILAAGYGTRLHRDLEELDPSHPLAAFKGTPKPLLPVHQGHSSHRRTLSLIDRSHLYLLIDRPLVDLWVDEFKFCHALKTSQKAQIDHVFLVTNHAHYSLYADWATRHGIPLSHIVDDQSLTNEQRLGAVACINLVLRTKGSLLLFRSFLLLFRSLSTLLLLL